MLFELPSGSVSFFYRKSCLAFYLNLVQYELHRPQTVCCESEQRQYCSAPTEGKYKGNYYSIYSIIFHIETCTSLFELFGIEIP